LGSGALFLSLTVSEFDMDPEYKKYIEQSESNLSEYAVSSLKSVGRKNELELHGNRTEFERDVQRILHSLPFRRLKHKTQVFFSPKDDHICTRMEHSLHVASISITICKQLNLNATLAEAISLAHDLGHPPFGHLGEKCLNNIHLKRKMSEFRHESQSLRIIDNFQDRFHTFPLDLTYEVRDGVVCHYGESNEYSIVPEKRDIKLVVPEFARSHTPATYEGCVVRLSDKISYLGRDIEDAQMAGLIKMELLPIIVELGLGTSNSQIIGNLIDDVVKNSKGKNFIGFSADVAEKIKRLNEYNYKTIYGHPMLKQQESRIDLLFSELFRYFVGVADERRFREKEGYYYYVFRDFLTEMKYAPEVDNRQKVSDFIAGMTDRFALSCFEDLFQVKSVV
jgi:dGTPase